MTIAEVVRRGEIFPGFSLPAIDGSSVSLESYRGRTNLVVVFAGDKMDESPVAVLLEELVARREEFALEAAQVLVAVTSQAAAVPQRGRWTFPVLVDDGAHIHRNVGATDAAGRPAPAVFVTDRFRTRRGEGFPPPQSRKRFSTGSRLSTKTGEHTPQIHSH